MAKVLTTYLGKVVRVEHGMAFTDKEHKSIAICAVGDVLILDNKTRKVTVKKPEDKNLTATQLKKQFENLQKKATEQGIEVEGKTAEELKVLIAGKE